jgi:hypothetical protein
VTSKLFGLFHFVHFIQGFIKIYNFLHIFFQLAKKALFEAFTREDLGLWLKKPIEQDQFPVLQ